MKGLKGTMAQWRNGVKGTKIWHYQIVVRSQQQVPK